MFYILQNLFSAQNVFLRQKFISFTTKWKNKPFSVKKRPKTNKKAAKIYLEKDFCKKTSLVRAHTCGYIFKFILKKKYKIRKKN